MGGSCRTLQLSLVENHRSVAVEDYEVVAVIYRTAVR